MTTLAILFTALIFGQSSSNQMRFVCGGTVIAVAPLDPSPKAPPLNAHEVCKAHALALPKVLSFFGRSAKVDSVIVSKFYAPDVKGGPAEDLLDFRYRASGDPMRWAVVYVDRRSFIVGTVYKPAH